MFIHCAVSGVSAGPGEAAGGGGGLFIEAGMCARLTGSTCYGHMQHRASGAV